MKKYIYIVLIIIGFSSCSEYQKALKSEDLTVKFDQASKKYEKGKYYKAITLFEQMAPSFRGNTQSEKMFYMFSQSYYKTKQYYLAGYQFESFAAGYPKSDKKKIVPDEIIISKDRKSVQVKISGLEKRKIYQFSVMEVRNQTGQSLRNSTAHYTLNELPNQ